MYYSGLNFPYFRYYLGLTNSPSVGMTNAFSLLFSFSYDRREGIVPFFVFIGVGIHSVLVQRNLLDIK